MIGYRLSELATPLQGRLLGGDAAFTRVSTDTRTLQPGDLFVPLQGPRFDGHDHLDAARLRGAVGALVSRGGAHPLPALKVADTLAGLGALARLWRQESPAPVVAVTGSNGKTTVKEMLASILGLQAEVLSTRGNLNNAVGLPLTLLRLQQQRWAVVEMGASAPGEIGYLSDIARPDLALLINAGRAHLEGFGSVEGVARAKAEILRGLKAGGFFVYNADDPFAPLWAELAAGWPTRTFGIRARADVVSPEPALELRWEGDGFVSRFPVHCASGEMEIELSLAGQHNRLNALAAIAAAEALGVGPETIRAGLKRLRPVAGRLRPLRGRGGARLIDDTYNANPDSVMAAIAVLTQLPGRPLLVLGELAEMGVEGPRFYREIGTRAREAGVRALYALGGAGAAVAGFGPGGRGF
ncbi:MAG TPA: UDP-N-acetylmuramoyl-tripeptide--D-alanyl-D-alanine ligase, partial [Sedimenticola sp.]|nr:UDP-N-acetylmuramoyl-tripeptide--D-alanyl-D-alanine ligase [Sedimenticola sp.]